MKFYLENQAVKYVVFVAENSCTCSDFQWFAIEEIQNGEPQGSITVKPLKFIPC